MAILIVQTAAGWCVLLLCNGALAYAAHLFARRFFHDAPGAVRWSVTGLAFIAGVVTITQVLSAFSLYNRPGVVFASLLVASLGHWLWGAHRNLSGEVEQLKQWGSAVIRSRGAILLCAAIVEILLAAARGLGSPPLEWNSLIYHLFIAARFVQMQTLSAFAGPPMMDHYANFPINGEIMTAWFLLPFHGDLVVGVIGFVFLALGAVAVYGLCREVGSGWEEAALAMCLLCFSPFLFVYVTTQGVDLQAFAVLMCGFLVGLRYFRHGHGREAVASFAAIGIAVGTKHTTLPLSVLLSVILLAGVFKHHKPRGEWGRAAAILACGLLLAIILGGRTYVINWYQTGNPMYPLELHIGGRQILPGSWYTAMIAEENQGYGSRRDDLRQFLNVFNYFPTWRLPTSGGPKFPLLLALAMSSCWFPQAARLRWPLRLLAGCGVLGILVVYAPGDGFPALARRIWPGAAARFVAPSLALLTVVAMPAVARLRGRWPALLAVLAGFTLWDMLVANTVVAASFPLAVGLASAVVVPAAVLIPWKRWRAQLSGIAVVGLFVVVGAAAACCLQVIRDGNRWFRYADSVDVHSFPRDAVDGWRFCDQPDHPRRIALATGWEHHGQNWFYYPLLGRRLQNTAVYIPTASSKRVGPAREVPGESHAFETWREDLRREKVDTVFVQKPWPIEESWMGAHPEAFTVVHTGDGFKVYDVVGAYAAK